MGPDIRRGQEDLHTSARPQEAESLSDDGWGYTEGRRRELLTPRSCKWRLLAGKGQPQTQRKSGIDE